MEKRWEQKADDEWEQRYFQRLEWEQADFEKQLAGKCRSVFTFESGDEEISFLCELLSEHEGKHQFHSSEEGFSLLWDRGKQLITSSKYFSYDKLPSYHNLVHNQPPTELR